jgi:hypothetical protein
MSYDLIFGRLGPRQTWDEYLRDVQRHHEGAAPELDEATWARIIQAVRAVLPHMRDSGGELEDEGTAIQLFCAPDHAWIQVPYWYTGNGARRVLRLMYRLAAVIEGQTGLRGYDPQIELPTADALTYIDQAVEVFDQVAASFASRGIQTYDHDAAGRAD